ncbi:MATE efflux family protein 3, chloroplastic [Hordeum vulgare]|nr:MATE efflux family protein 3, chloroplastic [Hordeum vulgare]
MESTALVKYVKNPGPTSRCHNEEEHKQRPDWFPEPDEFCLAGDLGISDEEEEDEVELPYLMKKSEINKKKMKDRGKEKAIKVVQGDEKEQYYRLRDYLQAVIDTNPGSRCIVTIFEDPENPAPTPRFKYMFYCLHSSKEGILNGVRPFIGLDGCFIKLTTRQQILTATGRYGNNNIYPIAFGVVDKEDGDSWTWFLTQLRCCIGSGSKFGTYTIISDGQKGLLKAINEVFPDSPQRYFLRHIYANFHPVGFRAAELKKLVDQSSYSFTKHGHELGMTSLKAECEGAWKWLEKIAKETWCRAKPTRTMFEGIRTKQMIKRKNTREKTKYNRWMITPNYSEKLEENKKRWDMTGVTCSHAIAAMSKENREIFSGSSSATQLPPEPPHQHQSSHIPASSAPPLGLKTMRTIKTAAPPRGSASTVSTASIGPAKSSPAPPRGSASTRAANAVRGFSAPRTSNGQAVILTRKRKRRPTSKFAAYFTASGNH